MLGELRGLGGRLGKRIAGLEGLIFTWPRLGKEPLRSRGGRGTYCTTGTPVKCPEDQGWMEPLHEPPRPETQAVNSLKPRICGLPHPLPSSAEENRGLGHIHIYVIASAARYLCPDHDPEPSSNKYVRESQTNQLVGEARRLSFACTGLSRRGLESDINPSDYQKGPKLPR